MTWAGLMHEITCPLRLISAQSAISGFIFGSLSVPMPVLP